MSLRNALSNHWVDVRDDWLFASWLVQQLGSGSTAEAEVLLHTFNMNHLLGYLFPSDGDRTTPAFYIMCQLSRSPCCSAQWSLSSSRNVVAVVTRQGWRSAFHRKWQCTHCLLSYWHYWQDCDRGRNVKWKRVDAPIEFVFVTKYVCFHIEYLDDVTYRFLRGGVSWHEVAQEFIGLYGSGPHRYTSGYFRQIVSGAWYFYAGYKLARRMGISGYAVDCYLGHQ